MDMLSEKLLINIFVDCLLGLRAAVKDITVEAKKEADTTHVFAQYIHRFNEASNAHITITESIDTINTILSPDGFPRISKEYNASLFILSVTENVLVGSEIFQLPYGKKIIHEALKLHITIRSESLAGEYIVKTILCQTKANKGVVILCLQKARI